MTEQTPPVDLADLAKKLLDLWQDQVAAAAADRDLADQLARLSAAMMRPAPASAATGSGGSPDNASAASRPHTTPFGAGQPGADPTAAAATMLDWWRTGMTAWSTAVSQQMAAVKSMQGDQRAQQAGRHSADEGKSTAAKPASSDAATAGSAATAPASQPGPGDLEQLRRRLAELDARLATLENPAGAGRRNAEQGDKATAGKSAPSRQRAKSAAPAAGEPGASAAKAGTTARRRRPGKPRQGPQ